VFITFDDRPSDSPFVERVFRSRSERAGTFLSMAASQWMMVVTKVAGRTTLTIRGPETRATLAECPADGEWFGILFKTGTFMPAFPAGRLIDRKDVTLKEGVAILDAVHQAGYFDQAHLTRSLRRFTGQTPAQIIRGDQQLSFLYKTALIDQATMILPTEEEADGKIQLPEAGKGFLPVSY